MARWGFPANTVGPQVAGGGALSMQLPTAIVRLGEQALWSAQRYVDATALSQTQARVFTVGLGNTGQGFAVGLTKAETSQKEASRVSNGQAFDIFAISCQTFYQDQFPIVGADVRNLVNNLVLSWDFNQAIIDIAPAALIGAGGGVYGDTADTGAADGGLGGSRTTLNNGPGTLWVYQTHPVMLAAGATFAVLLTWGVNATAVDGGTNNSSQIIRVHLLGRFKNAIAVG